MPAPVTINIPPFQLTTPERAALATALTLLVASQVFPQLSTSFGWLNKCGPISMVVSAAIAGAVLLKLCNRYTAQVHETSLQILKLQTTLVDTESSNFSQIKGLVDEITALHTSLNRIAAREASPGFSPIRTVSFARTPDAQLNTSLQLQQSLNKSKAGIEGLMDNFLTQLNRADDDPARQRVMNTYLPKFKEGMEELEKQFAAVYETYAELDEREAKLDEGEEQLRKITEELGKREQQLRLERSNLDAVQATIEDLKAQIIQAAKTPSASGN